MTSPITPLVYRPFTRAELETFPGGTILAMTWPSDPDPELFRRLYNGTSNLWAVLTSTGHDYDFEVWSHDDLFSEHALYAVVYQPTVSE